MLTLAQRCFEPLRGKGFAEAMRQVKARLLASLRDCGMRILPCNERFMTSLSSDPYF